MGIGHASPLATTLERGSLDDLHLNSPCRGKLFLEKGIKRFPVDELP
jgi:hypothetical protein